ncbi:MAG: hypothetical protein PVF17_00690 [Ignavibacteria bacterium]|jgi:hypothetical protein
MTFYKSNIPQATDTFSESQFNLRQNFKAINEIYSENHRPLTALESQGVHEQIIFTAQGSAPTPAADEVALFSEDNGNGQINLRARYQSSGVEQNATPFAFGRIQGLAGNTIYFPVTPVNVNTATSTFTAGSTFVINFTTNAANSNYYVFVSFENLIDGPLLISTPTVHSQTVSGFTVVIANLTVNSFMNFQVYEQ